MKAQRFKQQFNLAALTAVILMLLAPVLVSADATVSADNAGSDSSTSASSDSSTSATANKPALTAIITAGNNEINRRLKNLNALSVLINSTSKLSASDKANLSSEVSSAISGLTTLKGQLDKSTTVAQAAVDVTNMATEYKVYALVDPKVHLVKVADDQQAVEAKLTTLAKKLQTRITELGTSGSAASSASTAQTALTNMNDQLATAESLVTTPDIETLVNLDPSSDYSTVGSDMAAFNSTLQSARVNIVTALGDAKTIIGILETSSTTSPSTSNTTSN